MLLIDRLVHTRSGAKVTLPVRLGHLRGHDDRPTGHPTITGGHKSVVLAIFSRPGFRPRSDEVVATPREIPGPESFHCWSTMSVISLCHLRHEVLRPSYVVSFETRSVGVGRRASPSSRPIKRRDPTNYGGLSAQRRVAATAAASAGQGRLAAGASPLQSQPRRCRRFLSKFTAGLAVGCGFLWGADPGPCPSGEAGDGAIRLRWSPQPPCRRRRGR